MSLTALLFLALIMGLFFLTVIRDPIYGLIAYIVLYFLPHLWWWDSLPALRYSQIAVILTIVSMLFRGSFKQLSRTIQSTQSKWLLALGALSLITIFFAVNSAAHIFYLKILWQNILIYFVITLLISDFERLKKVIAAFIAGCTYLAYVAWQTGRGSGGRLEGIGVADGDDSNLASAAIVVAVPLLLHYLLIGSKIQKFLSLGGLVFVLNALILFNSRGAFVALFLSSLYFLFYAFKAGIKLPGGKKGVLLAAFFGFLAFFYLADPVFWTRMATLQDTSTEGSGYRMLIWKAAFDVVKIYPLGTGAEGFSVLSPQYIPENLVASNSGTRAIHNTYLQALTDYGYLGFVVFLGYLKATFSRCRKARRQLRGGSHTKEYSLVLGLEAGLVAHLIAAVFISRLYSELIYWLPALLGSVSCFSAGFASESEA